VFRVYGERTEAEPARFLTSAAASTIMPQRRRRRVLEPCCLTIGEATQYFFLVVSCLVKPA
jgi:hypothetical protein